MNNSHKIITITLLISLIEAGVVPHVKKGFWCGDPKISYKFDGDTITATALMVTCFLAPPVMMWLFEISISLSTHNSINKKTRFILTGIQTLRWYREFLLGMAAKLFLVDCLKTFIGEPRPHFMDTCIPDAGINCVNGTYISSYTCTNTVDTDWFVREATKSFPSGHTSIGFFSAIYMIYYLQYRVVHLSTLYTIPFLQTLWLFWAFMCGVTRITDHRHHWWDVVVGGFFGVTFALFTVNYCCKSFRIKNPRKSKSNKLPNISSDNHHQSVIRLLSTSSKEDDRDIRHESP